MSSVTERSCVAGQLDASRRSWTAPSPAVSASVTITRHWEWWTPALRPLTPPLAAYMPAKRRIAAPAISLAISTQDTEQTGSHMHVACTARWATPTFSGLVLEILGLHSMCLLRNHFLFMRHKSNFTLKFCPCTYVRTCEN